MQYMEVKILRQQDLTVVCHYQAIPNKHSHHMTIPRCKAGKKVLLNNIFSPLNCYGTALPLSQKLCSLVSREFLKSLLGGEIINSSYKSQAATQIGFFQLTIGSSYMAGRSRVKCARTREISMFICMTRATSYTLSGIRYGQC